jgi:hypothetical protein
MSTKYPSPLLGYNNNVRHKGRVFHIQTEDSGARYGHIITHLFMDGGRILKSVKTSYSEYIGSERMSEIVREMMKQQHKAMFIALRDGKFDPLAEGASSGQDVAAATAQQAPAAPVAAAVAAAQASPIGDAIAEVVGPMRSRAPSSSDERTARFSSQSIMAQEPEAPPTIRQSSRDGMAAARADGASDDIKLDVGAIERAAVPAAPILRDASDLPPPPANLFREKGSGRYRVSTGPPPPESLPPAPEEQRSRSSPAHAAVKGGSGERRYAPTRPASIFGQARPAQGKSIFGGDLISDKSLDEVILSYLAEDLDEKK